MTTDNRHRFTPIFATGMVLVMTCCLAGCRGETTQPTVAAAKSSSQPMPSADRMAVSDWPLPAAAGASQPDLSVSADGALLLSWVEKDATTDALKFARYASGKWTAPRTIAKGESFGNSADTPHVRATADGALWAQWLRISPAAAHARDVVLTRSGDGGATWAAPAVVNLDATPTEHGFVAMWPATNGRLGIAWLDGRDHAGGGHDDHAMHGPGMTMLRAAVFDAGLKRSEETAVDTSTCDCCQTDVAPTPKGPLLVYRDRAAGEIRDIATTRVQDGRWTPPRIVHADGWRMSACPVNGPAVASDGGRVAVGWYTGADDIASIRAAVSIDSGEHFGPPLAIDAGDAVLGRVDMAIDAHSIWLTWLREEPAGQSLWLARVALDGSRIDQRLRIARLAGRGRGTGVPRIADSGDRIHVVWTDVVDGAPKLDGAVIRAL